jgi:hypothetical protein
MPEKPADAASAGFLMLDKRLEAEDCWGYREKGQV